MSRLVGYNTAKHPEQNSNSNHFQNNTIKILVGSYKPKLDVATLPDDNSLLTLEGSGSSWLWTKVMPKINRNVKFSMIIIELNQILYVYMAIYHKNL